MIPEAAVDAGVVSALSAWSATVFVVCLLIVAVMKWSTK